MKAKKPAARSRIKVYWENPPGPRQGLMVERVVRGHIYRRDVGPHGLLSPPEAAIALKVTREFVYRLIENKKLKAVMQQGRKVIPVSSVKEYGARREAWRRNRSRS